jgi:hypothetical protein
MVEGVIIAYGCEPIPEPYHGLVPVLIPVRVTLIDSLERSVQKEIGLLIAERRLKRDQSPARVGAGIYATDKSQPAGCQISHTGQTVSSESITLKELQLRRSDD